MVTIGIAAQAQDSLNMSLLYRYDPDTIPTNGSREFNECWGYVTCDGQEIAVLGSSGRVHFFDVTDPVNTYEIAWFTGGSITTWRDMKSYKDRVYSVCDSCNEGLMIFDMSDAPNSVSLSNQTTDFWERAHNIFIDIATGRAYGVGTNTTNTGVVILDIETDPDNPILLENLVLPGGYVHDMYVHNNIAFVNHGNNGLYAYDLSDSSTPELLGTMTSYPQSGYNHSCWLDAEANTLVLCDETHNRGVKTVNVEDPSNMFVEEVFRSKLLAPADTASIAHNTLIVGNIAFVSYYHDGVAAFDISDPTNVEKVAFYDTEPNNTSYGGFTGCWGVFPFLPSGNILASDMTRGLHVLSLENVDLGAIHGGFETIYFPNAEIEPTGVSEICEADSVLLYTESGYDTYAWLNGNTGEIISTEDSVFVNETGNYTVSISNAHCSTTSLVDAEVIVNEFPDVTITIDGETEFCKGESVTLSVPPGAENYAWFVDFSIPIGNNENSITVTETGSYRIEASNDVCLQGSGGIEITVFEVDIFALSIMANTLTSIEAVDYQWFLNDEPIAGATNQSYEAQEDGEYFVEITDNNGCKGFSEKTNIVISNLNEIDILSQFEVFPNPTKDVIQIQLASEMPTNFEIILKTIDGKILKSLNQEVYQNATLEIDLKDYPTGVYFINLINERGIASKKIVKQ